MEIRKCGVWKAQSVEKAGCRKCVVWKMRKMGLTGLHDSYSS